MKSAFHSCAQNAGSNQQWETRETREHDSGQEHYVQESQGGHFPGQRDRLVERAAVQQRLPSHEGVAEVRQDRREDGTECRTRQACLATMARATSR